MLLLLTAVATGRTVKASSSLFDRRTLFASVFKRRSEEADQDVRIRTGAASVPKLVAPVAEHQRYESVQFCCRAADVQQSDFESNLRFALQNSAVTDKFNKSKLAMSNFESNVESKVKVPADFLNFFELDYLESSNLFFGSEEGLRQ